MKVHVHNFWKDHYLPIIHLSYNRPFEGVSNEHRIDIGLIGFCISIYFQFKKD